MGDGLCDGEDQAWGCDLSCYDEDGGDCAEPETSCDSCEFDFTAYGSECCDTALEQFGLNCETLTNNYNWDCAGCECPDDAATTCGDGVCDWNEDEASCSDCAVNTCADSGCGYWLNYGYSCEQLSGNYGYDCDLCEAEGACGGGSTSCADTDCGYWLDAGYDCESLAGYGYDCSTCDAEGACGGGDDGGGDACVNDDSTADSYGDTCSSWYDSSESEGSYGCTGGYDDDDFSAATQCCVCGGGGRDITNSPDNSPAVKSVGQLIKKVKNVNDVFIPTHKVLNREATSILESSLQKANAVKLIQTAQGLSYEADGFVGFEITLQHGSDFKINLTDAGFIADANTIGNTTKVVVINNETTELFTSTGDFEVIDVVAGTAGGTAVAVDQVVISKEFGFGKAYPNPFNPTTSVELAIPVDGFVSVKVYSITGQEVASLQEGVLQASATPYSFTWDASGMASGMYILQAERAGNVDVQKIMLMK
jgi:hypothetical protein